ncbi:hypothetical protein BGX27_000484, partial [Mortierella sp. AM989]
NGHSYRQVAKALKTSKQPSLLQVQPPSTPTTTMPLFKSNKNKSASVASTPAQTPRTSIQDTRPTQINTMTREQVLEIVLKKSSCFTGSTRNIM